MADEVEFRWFFGKKGDASNSFVLHAKQIGADSKAEYVPLYHGTPQVFEVAVETEDLVPEASLMRIKFNHERKTWPEVPWPLPWDPKYPLRSAEGVPYEDEATYKAVMDTLPPSVPLRAGFEKTLEYVADAGHPLKEAFDLFKGTEDDQDKAVGKIRTWVGGHLDDELMSHVKESIPPGLPQPSPRDGDHLWYPLGWEVKVIYGYFVAMTA